jgi:threonylcarbamoyladenosine tRNA methylthiotransferase MtaB
LADLVGEIATLPGNFRVRLSSIEATEVTRALLDVMAAYPDRICPHLHLCLQSGSDRVLSRMNRRWGVKRFVDRCEMFKQRFARPAITTDIIVGFPGETDEDFEASCATARQCGFSKIHIFPYSTRKGTPAALMSGRVPKSVQKQRVSELARVAQELRQRYFASLVGSDLQVLIEAHAAADQIALGTSCRYTPIRLSVSDDQRWPARGELLAVSAQAQLDGTALLAVPATPA